MKQISKTQDDKLGGGELSRQKQLYTRVCYGHIVLISWRVHQQLPLNLT